MHNIDQERKFIYCMHVSGGNAARFQYKMKLCVDKSYVNEPECFSLNAKLL